jgi:hypothetical protein
MMANKKTARIAGFYYLLNVILSILYMEYIPGKVAVWGNPEATMDNLLNNEMLYRVGIVIGVVVHISFIMLPLTLHKLLNHVNKHYALVMVIFALISVPISFTLLIDQYEMIDILNNYSTLELTQQTEANLTVMAFYDRLLNGFFLDQTFWGLWLFPFGYLAFKSGFLPKFLGVALMLGCITYMIDIFGGTIFSNYYDFVNTQVLIIPAAIGEIGICLWLLIVGVKENIRF